MNADNKRIVTFLGHHLLLLDRAYTVLRIEYNDFRSRNIGKSCQRCLSGISRGGSQNHDLILYMILLRSGRQQIRQNGQCHILKSDRGTVEQFQVICAVRLHKRCDLLCVELAVIRGIDTVL